MATKYLVLRDFSAAVGGVGVTVFRTGDEVFDDNPAFAQIQAAAPGPGLVLATDAPAGLQAFATRLRGRGASSEVIEPEMLAREVDFLI